MAAEREGGKEWGETPVLDYFLGKKKHLKQEISFSKKSFMSKIRAVQNAVQHQLMHTKRTLSGMQL